MRFAIDDQTDMIARLAEIWALMAGVVLLCIMAVTMLNIAAFAGDKIAAVFGGNIYGLSGFEDFVSLAIAAAGLMFLPYCQLRRGHVFVDLFANFMPFRLKRVLDVTWLICIAGLALFLAYWMLIGLFQVKDDNVLTTILAWPIWPSFIPGVLSLLLWAMVALSQIIKTDPE